MVDLHLHSLHSDGSDAPAAIVAQGRSLGLSAMVLTDHDTLAGVPEFLDAAHDAGIAATTGVEISTQFESVELHILGYGVDPANAALLALLAAGRGTRRTRNALIAERLAALGYPITLAEVEALAGDPETTGRPHFAEALLRHGYVEGVQEAFDRFLGQRGAAYVPRDRPPAEDAVRAIHAAHGVAVWAHPHAGFSADSIRKILATLIPAGLGGLEAWHPNHSTGKIASARVLARENGLIATGGSDYHGSFKPYITLAIGTGTLDTPDTCWAALSAAIRRTGGYLP